MSAKKKLTIVTEPPKERPFIRPSSYQIAEKCQRAPWLAHRHPEQDDATRKGNSVDAEVSAALTEGKEPTSKEARDLVEWVRGRFSADAEYFVQRKVVLYDPVTGERITQGTPDLLVLVRSEGYLAVVDWKKSGQLFSGYLSMPEDNLQQQIYMISAGVEFGVERAQVILVCFDERKIRPIEGPLWEQDAWWPLLDRVKAVPPVDFAGDQPEANKGDHCDTCWERMHCAAYLLPAIEGAPVALAPFMEGGAELDNARALDALDWLDRADAAIKRAKAVRDQVEDQLKAYATTRGPIPSEDGASVWGPVPTNGKRSGPKLDELEELGLGHLIKPGKPGVKYDWKKVQAG